MVNVSVIGCNKTGAVGSFGEDLLAIQSGTGAFAGMGPASVTGYLTCGGCPGRRVVERARLLTKTGTDVIALSSYLARETDGSPACPHREKLLAELGRRLPGAIVLDRTY